jgi:hypothetical protein
MAVKITEQPGEAKELLEKFLASAESKSLSVGWFPWARYNKGKTVAMIAAQNEYGSTVKNIPPRPFMGNAITKNSAKWQQILDAELHKAYQNGGGIQRSLEILGAVAAGDVRQEIAELQDPPLAPATIKARLSKYRNKKEVGGLTKPLIDSGVMFNTVSFEVE